MANSGQQLIFLARDKVQFASGGKIFTFTLPENLVKDLEIVDTDFFKNELTNYLKKKQIILSSAIVLLSESVCFVSEEKDLENFIENLPFDNPAGRVVGDKLIGTNKDLYQDLCEVIGTFGAKIKTVSPIFIFKETIGVKELNDSLIKFILDNEEKFLASTFVYTAPFIAPKPLFITKNPVMAKREKVLIGIFTILLVGFLIWVLTSLS